MPDLPQVFSDMNHTGADFLIIDLDLAMVFLDLARTTKIEDTAHRNHNNARRAYDAVLHLLSKVRLDEAERDVIAAKLVALKERLAALDQQF